VPSSCLVGEEREYVGRFPASYFVSDRRHLMPREREVLTDYISHTFLQLSCIVRHFHLPMILPLLPTIPYTRYVTIHRESEGSKTCQLRQQSDRQMSMQKHNGHAQQAWALGPAQWAPLPLLGMCDWGWASPKILKNADCCRTVEHSAAAWSPTTSSCLVSWSI
jgi:hypothetical protein